VNAPDSILEAQTDALLRRVAREQETRCRHARESAAEQARVIVERAWAEARGRLRQAVEEERRSMEQTLADRRAAHETAARRRSQSSLRAVMDEAWGELPAALESTWRRLDARERWCKAACAAAMAALDHAQGCVLEVDAGAGPDVADIALAALAGWTTVPAELRRVSDLGPGLRIRCGRASLDATLPGLLASRERIESDLLAEIERLGRTPGETQA
jgi:hypothetical protein